MKKEEISIQDIWQALSSHLIIIAVITLLFAGGLYGYTKLFVPKQYAATAKLYAISNVERDTTYVSVSEQNASRRLVETYIVILKSDAVLNEVSKRLADESNIKISAAGISGSMSGASINETEIFSLTVVNTDPKKAQAIVNTLASVAETKIVEILETGGVSVIDYAKLPVSPISPNAKNKGIIGAVIGFVLSCVIVLLRSLTDTTIWTEEDLTKRYDMPVLGAIPRLETLPDTKERSGAK